jgi:hypothetical protein
MIGDHMIVKYHWKSIISPFLFILAGFIISFISIKAIIDSEMIYFLVLFGGIYYVLIPGIIRLNYYIGFISSQVNINDNGITFMKSKGQNAKIEEHIDWADVTQAEVLFLKYRYTLIGPRSFFILLGKDSFVIRISDGLKSIDIGSEAINIVDVIQTLKSKLGSKFKTSEISGEFKYKSKNHAIKNNGDIV